MIIQVKAIEQYFHVVLFIMLYKVVQYSDENIFKSQGSGQGSLLFLTWLSLRENKLQLIDYLQ